MKPPVLIAGPTAAGKSRLAMALAAREACCIVNADALQVYQGWRILTARPDTSDEAVVRHRLFGTVSMQESYSVGDWLRDLAGVLTECRNDRLRPIIVGGTGLYFSALTEGLSKIPKIPKAVREQADRMRSSDGLRGFTADLEVWDPETLAKVDRNNPMRLQRAWEVYKATGRGLSDWQQEAAEPLIPLSSANTLVLQAETDWLGQRMDLRLQQMLASGVLDECRAVLAGGWHPELLSSRALGAAEFVAHLEGQTSLDDAVKLTLIRTRQYAKRQRTWFRGRMGDWQRADAASDTDQLVGQIT